MKVLIAAAAFSSGMSGIQRHAFNVVRCLLQQPEVSQVNLVVAPWQRDLVQSEGLDTDPRFAMQVEEMGRSSIGRNTWYYWRLPQLARSQEADIVHLSYPAPVNAAAYPCPTAVTLHDLYPYEIPLNFGFPKFIFNRVVLRQCLRNVDAIACVSDMPQAGDCGNTHPKHGISLCEFTTALSPRRGSPPTLRCWRDALGPISSLCRATSPQ